MIPVVNALSNYVITILKRDVCTDQLRRSLCRLKYLLAWNTERRRFSVANKKNLILLSTFKLFKCNGIVHVFMANKTFRCIYWEGLKFGLNSMIYKQPY